MFRSAYYYIRLHTLLQEVFHGMLRRLGLQFPRSRKVRHVGQVNDNSITLQFPFQLSYTLHERKRLYITHRAAYFRYHEIIPSLLPQQLYSSFDFVRNMRNYLHRTAEIIAPTLFLYHGLVNTPRRNIVRLRRSHVREPLIVSQIEVCLRTVLRNVALAMFIRVKRTRIYVYIRIQLLNGYRIAP